MTEGNSATPAKAAVAGVKRKRWPTMLLAGSLTLNLLVLGLIAGAHFRDGRDTMMAPPPSRDALHETGLAPFFDAMPRGARGRLSQDLLGHAGGLGPDRAALAQELRGMIEALRAENFDPATLEALLAAQQARASQRAATGRTMLIKQIGAMTKRERSIFADRLEQRFEQALSRVPRTPPAPAPVPAN